MKDRLCSRFIERWLLAAFFLLASSISLSSLAVDVKTAQRIDEELEKNRPEIIKIRRFLHMNPELSNREFETSRLVSSKLQSLGLEVRTGIARTGVVAVLKGSQPGPAVAIRADMDALPIQEMTGLPYKSLNPGIMHACGHDFHTSIALGTAMVLNQLKDRLKGSVIFVFQPAEEGPPADEEGGAELMIKEGVFDNLRPSAIFSLHVWPENVGRVMVSPGDITASSDWFRVSVIGKSSHGARPHEGIDAIVIASEIIIALQTIISRSIDPTDPAVISVGTIAGGTKANIIADKVTFEGTVRTLSEVNRKKIPVLMETIVKRITSIYETPYEFEYKRQTPSVYNHPELVAAVTPTLIKLLGKERVLEWRPQMIAEDFSFFSQKIPAFYFFLGVKSPAQPIAPPLHSPYFNPDERAIPVGIRVFCHLVVDALDLQSAMTADKIKN